MYKEVHGRVAADHIYSIGSMDSAFKTGQAISCRHCCLLVSTCASSGSLTAEGEDIRRTPPCTQSPCRHELLVLPNIMCSRSVSHTPKDIIPCTESSPTQMEVIHQGRSFQRQEVGKGSQTRADGLAYGGIYDRLHLQCKRRY